MAEENQAQQSQQAQQQSTPSGQVGQDQGQLTTQFNATPEAAKSSDAQISGQEKSYSENLADIKAKFEQNLKNDLSKKETENKDSKPDHKKEHDNLFDALDESKDDSASWSWDEDKKGDGDRPEWLRKDFKSAKEQAKAYNALVKKFGDFSGAPESYDFSKVENKEFKITPDGKNAQEFSKIAKDMNLSQDGFNKVLDFFNKSVAPTFKGVASEKVDVQAEIAKLGDNGAEKVRVLSTWMQNNFSENYPVLKSMMKSADNIKAFMKIRESMTKNDGENNSINYSPSPISKQSMHDSLKIKLSKAISSNNQAEKESLMQEYKKLFNS